MLSWTGTFFRIFSGPSSWNVCENLLPLLTGSDGGGATSVCRLDCSMGLWFVSGFVCYSSSCTFAHTHFPWLMCPDSAQGIYGCNYSEKLWYL